ncbi:AraC-like DNA-binding protein [Stackebrandtia endophytica]|uniref:AraC-like DNA-binding protein n=1 Tax=Stackebrandtia endophytica TaxID=1496996 RepID=A0A543AVV6_9ACTN|nr:AraC family transcriptional regulator [Stackebrandtia endophytica]TQL76672.1 AraC-like DNA-binding protein [Stackebrandtia endophytica]
MDTLRNPTDRLGRVLHRLRMRGTFYSRADLGEPWALDMPVIPDSVSFHVLTSGTCWLTVPNIEPVELRTGDLALVPHGAGHQLSSHPDAGPAARVDLLPQEYLNPHYSTLQYGGTGRRSRLICGIVAFDEPAARQLLRQLPAVVLVGGPAIPASTAIRDTLRLMSTELEYLRPGGEAVATRLADILIVQAIRAWLEQDSAAQTGWLRAIQDPRIGGALDAIHSEPGGDWNLERLAQRASMSRSTFAARFHELVGEPPMSYVTRWRMNLAHSRLLDSDVTVAKLAGELGYRSEASFHRAFSRTIGQTPGDVRSGRSA